MNVLDDFNKFKERNPNDAYRKMIEFLDQERVQFSQQKASELASQGLSDQDVAIRVRQGWVSFIGSGLEAIIKDMILEFCQKNNLGITSNEELDSNNLTFELDLVKRATLVHFGNYSLLPDADLIIYRIINSSAEVIAIISIKGSFRERYTETPFWKLKLSENEITKNILVFMITPDRDDEISFNDRPRKSRIVLEYELDGVYLAKENFDESEKVKSIDSLISDLNSLV